MSTDIRPELSKKNGYWIERHRYYELKHFCLQFSYWKRCLLAIDDGLVRPSLSAVSVKSSSVSDPTAKAAEERARYKKRIELVEKTAMAADSELAGYILRGVTDGVTYDYLKTHFNIPCCRKSYYEAYRRFFWLLDRARD